MDLFENPIDGEGLLSLFGFQYQLRGEQLLLKCPFHDDNNPSFSMNKETTQYFCFGCGNRGNWYTFIKDLTNQNPYKFLGIDNNFTPEKSSEYRKEIAFRKVLRDNQKNSIKKEALVSPQFNIIAKKENPFVNIECKKYCMERNINQDDIKKYDMFYIEDGYIGVTRFSKRLVIPVHDREENILAYEGRDITRKADKKCIYPYKSKIGSSIFQLHTLDYSKPTVFVEGIMDVISVRKAISSDYQVTSCFGIELTNIQKEIVNKFKEVILFFDPDEGGRRGVHTFNKVYQRGDLFIANNLTYKYDPGESSNREILEAIENRFSITEFFLKENNLLQENIIQW